MAYVRGSAGPCSRHPLNGVSRRGLLAARDHASAPPTTTARSRAHECEADGARCPGPRTPRREGVVKLLRSLDEESRVPWATIYLVIAILWGLVLVVVTPPFQAFDENAHYSRAWSVAQGEIDPGEDGQVTLPANVAALPATFNYVDVFRGGRKYDPSLVRQIIWQPISSETVEQPTSASGYGPLGYVPQVAGIEIVRVLGRSPLLGLYVGRVLNLLAAVIVTWFAIRLLPFAKPVIVLVALFPTTIFLSACLLYTSP